MDDFQYKNLMLKIIEEGKYNLLTKTKFNK